MTTENQNIKTAKQAEETAKHHILDEIEKMVMNGGEVEVEFITDLEATRGDDDWTYRSAKGSKRIVMKIHPRKFDHEDEDKTDEEKQEERQDSTA